jgi:hypothetical protein
MSHESSGSPRGPSVPEGRTRGVHALGLYNLAAVYRTLDDAEASVAALEAAGVDRRQLVVQDRRFTDEGPANRVIGPIRSGAPPTGEPVQTPIRRRDADVARSVFSRTVLVAAVMTLGGAAMGFLVGLAFFGFGLGTWVALVAGAVAGSVFGAMAGGTWGGMSEARAEEGVLVEVNTDDPDESRRIAEILGSGGPIRLDRMAVEKGLRSA